jgi:hypothetical protein
MDNWISGTPERIVPYIITRELNQPVLAMRGPFTLDGPQKGTLDADLMFRWVPSPAVEFIGVFLHAFLDLDAQWSLVAEGDAAFRVPLHITHTKATGGSKSSRVSGILQGPLNLGEPSFEVLQFSLANFPNYLGESIRYEREDVHHFIAGRLNLTSDQGVCQLDFVPETAELRKRASQDAGFVLSHVGQWLPSKGKMTIQDTEEILELLGFWFGFLRGAWAGPLFPQGIRAGEVVWRQFAAWRLRESRRITTWIPKHNSLDLASTFSRFAQLTAVGQFCLAKAAEVGCLMVR